MGETMDEDQSERFVQAFERIASALEGIYGEAKQAGTRHWPEQRIQREAVVSRVESDEQRELKQQGARRRTVQEVIDPEAQEQEEEYGEIIGERERQWRRDHTETPKERNAGPQDADSGKAAGRGAQKAKSKAK